MDITTELLHPSDWQMYKTIQLEALQSDPQAFGSSYKEWEIFSDEKWQERPSDPDTCIVIAKDNDTPIGLIGYHVKNKGKDAHLWGMFVSKKYRGKGVGKELLEKIIEKAEQAPSIRKLSLDVNPNQVSAVQLYKSIGFTEIGEREYMMGDGVKRLLKTMRKQLR